MKPFWIWSDGNIQWNS